MRRHSRWFPRSFHVKYLAEYRDAEAVRQRLEQLAAATTRPWTVMEICGGQTHSFLRYGIDELLPPAFPCYLARAAVCVTPANKIDQAIGLSQLPQVAVCTYGDMLRVRKPRGFTFRQSSRRRRANGLLAARSRGHREPRAGA